MHWARVRGTRRARCRDSRSRGIYKKQSQIAQWLAGWLAGSFHELRVGGRVGGGGLALAVEVVLPTAAENALADAAAAGEGDEHDDDSEDPGERDEQVQPPGEAGATLIGGLADGVPAAGQVAQEVVAETLAADRAVVAVHAAVAGVALDAG